MVMRSPIPSKVRELLSNDPYMSNCCIRFDAFCEGRIEWHHAFTYAGRRQNEPWCILPACHYHHLKAGHKLYKAIFDSRLRERIYYFKAEEDFKEKYPHSTLLPIVVPLKKRVGRPKKI